MQMARPSVSSEMADAASRPVLTSRAQAAMLSAACGDALGWPIEPRGQRVGGVRDLQPRLSFIEWTRREGGGYAPYQRHVPAGTYSDDTQLMLAVARSLGRGEAWWEHLTQFELPAWTLYEIGGGGAVKRAAQGWAKEKAPWEATKDADRQRYFTAGANGVAMRILPHAIFGAGDPNFDRVCERIVTDGLTTHGHPRALVGALAAGYAMWTALRWKGKVNYGELIDDCLGERSAWSRSPEHAFPPGWREAAGEALAAPYEELWDRTCMEMLDLLSHCRKAMERGSIARDTDVLEELGAFGKEGGAGTRTAAIAIYLASRYVAKPTAGLLAAAFAKRADADTIACITGAMLGAFSGDDRVDGLANDLIDAPYIHHLAAAVARGEVDRVPPLHWPSRMKPKILGELAELPQGGEVSLPLFGRSIVKGVERPETKSANEITIWWLSTELGQTLPVTRIKKIPPGGSPMPKQREVGSAGHGRATQLTIEETPLDESGFAQSTWIFLFVRNLAEALGLYNGILGIPVVRDKGSTAVLKGHIVLEESDLREPREGEGLRAPQVVGVYVQPEALLPLRRRLADAGYEPSEVAAGRNGERFRVWDQDGHLIEVFTSPPSH